jgi:hypothetical protein
MELGQPTLPKSTTEIGHVESTKKNSANDAKYKVQPDPHSSLQIQVPQNAFRSIQAK